MLRNLFLLSLTILSCARTAESAIIDLSGWSVVQYNQNDQGAANWVLSGGNTVARQTLNADSSILLSDFDATDTVINGTWKVDSGSDDDFMGFVFGYQNSGKFYLFDWKQGTQDGGTGYGLAEQGMSIKTVNFSTMGVPEARLLWPTAGGSTANGSVTSLYHNTTSYNDFTDYNFHLEFHPGQFTIEVRQGVNLLLSTTLNDNTYTSGKFGFYNYSQDNVVYQGFTLDSAPPVSSVPEPASLAIWGIGALGCAIAGYRRRKAA